MKLFDKPASRGTKHVILKYEPEVRKMIHSHCDKVLLDWGSYIVEDRYHALICYHCQRFGHQSANCMSELNGEGPHCYKCAGQHNSKDYTETDAKCINCMRYKKSDLNHSANDLRGATRENATGYFLPNQVETFTHNRTALRLMQNV